MSLRAHGAPRPLDAVLQAPPSKSVTHRALLAAALASGTSTLVDPLEADDTSVTREGLAGLGITVRTAPRRWVIEGRSGNLPGGARIALKESGTSMRFLLAAAALGRARSELDGGERLRQRPVAELVVALTALGGQVVGSSLPLLAGGGVRGGTVRLSGARSSQFASALLLVGARLPEGIDLTLEPPVVSLPYVLLTVQVLEAFGVTIDRRAPLRWSIAPQDYAAREYVVEGDHSSASYLLAAAAIVGGRVRVEGLNPASAQSDAVLPSILAGLGCRVDQGADWIEVHGTGELPPFELDLADCPDLAPTLAVVGLFANGPVVLRRLAHLRIKESDRLESLAVNLRALGRPARVVDDRLEIGAPQGSLKPATIATAADHRMAMAFAVAGLRLQGIVLDDRECVAKSYPGFWHELRRLG